MTDTRLLVAKVKEHEELKAIDFIHRGWHRDKENKLAPLVLEARELSEKLEKRYLHIMNELDTFFKKKQLVPKEAEFLDFIEDGAIYAAPRVKCEIHMIGREE